MRLTWILRKTGHEWKAQEEGCLRSVDDPLHGCCRRKAESKFRVAIAMLRAEDVPNSENLCAQINILPGRPAGAIDSAQDKSGRVERGPIDEIDIGQGNQS